MTRKQIEKKYGVRIVEEPMYFPTSGRWVKTYKIYSADGCKWENGLKTIKAVEIECRLFSDALLAIKEKAQNMA